MTVKKYKVCIRAATKGGYWAFVPSLVGCFTQGETMADLEDRIREAVEGFDEAQPSKEDRKVRRGSFYYQKLEEMLLPPLTSRQMIMVLKMEGFETVGWRERHIFLKHPTKSIVVCVPFLKPGIELDSVLALLIIQESGFIKIQFSDLLAKIPVTD